MLQVVVHVNFLTIVDDYSRSVWVYLLIDKTEVFQMFTSFSYDR